MTPLQKQYEKRGWRKGVDISFGRRGVNSTFDEGCEFKEKGCDYINSFVYAVFRLQRGQCCNGVTQLVVITRYIGVVHT